MSKKYKVLAVAILLVAAGVATAGFIFRDHIADVISTNSDDGKPKFVFDTAKFPEWATAGNIKTNPKDVTNYQGDEGEIPVASITITQCEVGSHCNVLVEKCEPWSDDNSSCKELASVTTNTHCFVMAFYYDTTIESGDAAVAKYIDRQKSFDDYMTVQESGVKALSMNTPEGSKPYNFHYYDYSAKGSSNIKRGNAIGYIPLTSGHVEVRGICSESSQLDETLSVLSSVQLNYN